MEIKKYTFYASGTLMLLSTKTGYNRYIVGLSLGSCYSSTVYYNRLTLDKITPTDSIYGEYNSGGIFLKGGGNNFILPINIDNPYYEISGDKYLFLDGASSAKPVTGILLYYEISTASNIQRTLLGVGL